YKVTGVQTCALPISVPAGAGAGRGDRRAAAPVVGAPVRRRATVRDTSGHVRSMGRARRAWAGARRTWRGRRTRSRRGGDAPRAEIGRAACREREGRG